MRLKETRTRTLYRSYSSAWPAKDHVAGFTIVEIMVASAVFAVLLIIITIALLQVTRVYYKGITSNKTQEIARTVIEDISRTIQFSGGTVSAVNSSNGRSYFCVNNIRYTFVTGQKLDSGNHVIVKDESVGCPGPADWNDWASLSNPQELMAPGMRLAKLTVGPSDSSLLYPINIRVVAGDDDLLCSPSVAGDCTASTTSTSLGNNDIRCKDVRAGTQFCAVSELQTTVQKRI